MAEKRNDYFFAIVLAIAGIIVVSGQLYSIETSHDIIDIHTPQIDAAMQSQLQLTLAHLEIEEMLSGDTTTSMETINSHFDRSAWYLNAMLAGGDNGKERFISTNDPDLSKGIMRSIESVHLLKSMVGRRLSAKKVSQISASTDQEFDRIFKATLESENALGKRLLKLVQEERQRNHLVDSFTVSLSMILFVALTAYFVFRHRRELHFMDQLNELATHDSLTGLLNRRSFDQIIVNEWNHMIRSGDPIALVMCDIDHFKMYNDTLGHQAGDKCLKEISGMMQEIARRPVDSVIRYGGEEFIYILPYTDAEGAGNLASLLHRKLREKRIPHPGSPIADHVTISIGIASICPKAEDVPEALIGRVDRALYLAKSEGRNRTCTSK